MFSGKLKPGITDNDLRKNGYDVIHDRDVYAVKRTPHGNVFIDHLGNVLSFNNEIIDENLVENEI